MEELHKEPRRTFGRAVGRASGYRRITCKGRHQNDPPASAKLHPTDNSVGAIDHPIEVDLHRPMSIVQHKIEEVHPLIDCSVTNKRRDVIALDVDCSTARNCPSNPDKSTVQYGTTMFRKREIEGVKSPTTRTERSNCALRTVASSDIPLRQLTQTIKNLLYQSISIDHDCIELDTEPFLQICPLNCPILVTFQGGNYGQLLALQHGEVNCIVLRRPSVPL